MTDDNEKVPNAVGLWDTNQAAKFLGVRPWTLRQWVCEKRVPYIKLGKLVKFDRSRLEHWIKNQSVEPVDHHKKMPTFVARAGQFRIKRDGKYKPEEPKSSLTK